MSKPTASIMPATSCGSESEIDLAFASRPGITIICKLYPLTSVPLVGLPNIDRILSTDGDLQPVVDKARVIRELSRLCNAFLPPELARQAQAANFKDGKLVILAANSAAAAKLKLLSESLGVFLAKQRLKVSGVSVRVQPNASQRASQRADAASHKRVQISSTSLAELAALHARLGDSPARDALRALLEHQAGLPPPKPLPEGAQKETATRSARSRRART
jgi:hypothetical protein